MLGGKMIVLRAKRTGAGIMIFSPAIPLRNNDSKTAKPPATNAGWREMKCTTVMPMSTITTGFLYICEMQATSNLCASIFSNSLLRFNASSASCFFMLTILAASGLHPIVQDLKKTVYFFPATHFAMSSRPAVLQGRKVKPTRQALTGGSCPKTSPL